MIGVFINVTARKRAEEALQEREQTLQSIFRAAPVGIGMVSHRRITQVNDQLCRMTGYAREELVGQDARLLYTSDEAYEYVGREKYTQILADGTGAVETQWRTKDGAVRDILLSSSPVDLSRPYEDVVFTALDITRLRESERALASYMDDLQRSNEEWQRFAVRGQPRPAGAAQEHDQFLQLLERRYRGRLDSDADEYIAFIVEGGNRMQRLIEDLLRLSRVETKARAARPDGRRGGRGRRAPADGDVDPRGRRHYRGRPPARGDGRRGPARAGLHEPDRERPEVLPAGCCPSIRISAERAGAFWRFAVQDNGIGIEAEYLDRIFVIFQRLHTRDEYEGTGIGLAVVRKIVERHGGRIGVRVDAGRGLDLLLHPAGRVRSCGGRGTAGRSTRTQIACAPDAADTEPYIRENYRSTCVPTFPERHSLSLGARIRP